MPEQADVTIYGGGMSGLIAAIDLSRKGYGVVVHDREDGYGGDGIYNPSTHTTSIDVERSSEYIGIDLSSVFHPLQYCPFYFHDTRIDPPLHVLDMHTVERGNRPTSLDTLLFREAKDLGVEFEFNSPLKDKNLGRLPENTIVACGLNPSVYEMLNIPYLRWNGWISRGEIGFSNHSWIWMDEVITEYGYLSSCNNYYFNLLFSTHHIGRESLDKYQDFMVRNEGVEHKEWDYVSGAVPLANPKNPRLTQDGLIMCGTISGAMDPFFWFGILGALVTGKVAAMAVYDRTKAEEEFARFTRRFGSAYRFKNAIWYKIRPHVGMIERSVKLVGKRNLESIAEIAFASGIVPFATPGFAQLGVY